MNGSVELTTTSAPSIVEDVASKKNPGAVALGRRGGKKTAQKGSAYFRRLQAKRKNRRGGRPRRKP